MTENEKKDEEQEQPVVRQDAHVQLETVEAKAKSDYMTQKEEEEE